MSPLRSIFACAAVWALAASLWAKPVLYIIGDSTVRNGTSGQMGWGDPLVAEFDPAKIEVINRAIGGRSSRTFLTEDRWRAVMANLKPGDFVLMQFGHNDGGPMNDERCRASIKGIGEKHEKIVRKTDGKPETVQTYGWYLTKYIRDAKSKGALPLVVSPVPRNIWKDGKIGRADKDYGLWAQQTANQEQVPFIDLNGLLADRYEALGHEKVADLYAGSDHTHHSPRGAEFNATVMAGAIRSLKNGCLAKNLLPGNLWLPSVFSDHMVLQREMPVPVWGRATPGAEITVRLAVQSVATKADESGHWRIDFPPMNAGGPFNLEVTTTGGGRRFSDVLVGEVWLCSGQSNMDFTLAPTSKRPFSGVTDWQKEVTVANHPQLRMFTAEWTLREQPQREVAGKWSVCTPDSAVDFSAVAHYFGLALQQNMNVPVGLVTCAYGASTIESWIRAETLRAHPQFEELLKAFDAKRIAFRDNPKDFENYGTQLAKRTTGDRPLKDPDPVHDQHNPFVLHNGMIAPIVPYALRGAIWYQGESNLNTRNIYPELQRVLIDDWRSLWNSPEMPFYFVQLAAHKQPSTDPAPGGPLAEMREAQAKSLSIPHTGMAVTIDIGDEKDIHPRNKLEVGKRLARLALTGTYCKSGTPCGPVYRDASVQGSSIRVHFDHIHGGLVAKSGTLRGFAIAASDGRFTAADAVIEGDSVMVSSPIITTPAFVRYAWSDNPVGANLCNGEGLPAAPFRTDP
jgi:sialate O-acetylesterase